LGIISSGAVGGRWTPYIGRDGLWRNGTCGCTNNCHCGDLCEIWLEGPVYDICEVWIDGVLLEATAYTLHFTDRGTMLVRTDGECWPECSDVTAPCDVPGEGGFCVMYRTGLPLDDAAIAAVSEATCELLKACCGAACRLPKKATRVVRQGVTVEMQPTLISSLASLPLVEAWLSVVNPNNLPAPPRVYSTNLRRPCVTAIGCPPDPSVPPPVV
jgi:hypothetical protein